MTEPIFELKDFPDSVEQLAELAVSILECDSRVEWVYKYDTEHWDARIELRQGDNHYVIGYGAGDNLTYFLSQVITIYSLWKRKVDKKT